MYLHCCTVSDNIMCALTLKYNIKPDFPLDNVHSWPDIFPNPAPEGRTETLQMTYIPQMLAEYIQYQ